MSERQPLLVAAASSSQVSRSKPKTKGVNPLWSPKQKWLRKGQSSRSSFVQRRDSFIAGDDDEDSSSSSGDESQLFRKHESGFSAQIGNRQPSAREKLAYYLDYTTVGRWWQVFDATLNVAFVAFFVYMTTYIIRDGSSGRPTPPGAVFVVDTIIAFVLLAQWLPRIWLSIDPLSALGSWFSTVSFLATVPVIYAFFEGDNIDTDYLDANQVLAFLYPMRFWRMHLSVMMVFAPSKTVAFNFSPITQKAVKLGLSIFNTLITVTAWVHICLYVIQRYYDLSFFDVFYTIAVSSTSGLSTQIIPDNPFSRIVIMYVMIVGAIFIPTNLADLLALIRNQSKYDKAYKSTTNRSHVLVVGNYDSTSLRDFLFEFFCEDHGAATMTTHVVLMNPSEPSEELEALLADPLYQSRVRYVKGTPMSFSSLERARARAAKACFVMANRFSDNPAVEDDAETVMTALAIKKFHKKANIFAQVILPQSKIHFQILADHILCIDEFKLGMLAQNCLAPGFSTMLYLLTTSIPDAIKNKWKNKKQIAPWVDEFADGAEMEIYAVQLSTIFSGMRFAQVAERIYMVHLALMFAIGFQTEDPEPWIVMNPQDYIIKGGETAYIITTQSGVADHIATQGICLNDVPAVGIAPAAPDNDSAGPGHSGVLASPIANGEQDELLFAERTIDSGAKPSISLNSAKDDLISLGKNRATPTVEQEPPTASIFGGATKSDFEALMPASLPETVIDHVLICSLSSSFPQNLAFFIAPFRHKAASPIVILCAEEPRPEQWVRLAAFSEVYYIVGTPLLRKDLQRARVDKAFRAVVMANPQQSDVTDRASDAQGLLAVLNIQAMSSAKSEDQQNIFTMVEFIHAENAKFLGGGEKYYTDGLHGHNLLPCFVGGHVFFNAMFSSLLCQTYYNPHLLHVLKHFIFNGTHSPPQQSLPTNGRFSRLFRTDSAASWFFNLAHTHTDGNGAMDPDAPEQIYGNLFQTPLPPSGQFTTYGSLFRYLLREYKTLALGLYRRTVENKGLVKYVVVNPKPTLRLRGDDLVFVLAEKIPVW